MPAAPWCRRRGKGTPLLLLGALGAAAAAAAGGPSTGPSSGLRAEAAGVLKRAAVFYRGRVAVRGGYVYYYSPDLSERWGEGRARPDTIFVQPPGTPTVGLAYLRAHAATGDSFYLDAAREAAEALVYGQLESGGWTQTIHFGPAPRRGRYRRGGGGSWNVSSLDDGQTQAALLLLMRADRALGSRHAEIRDAAAAGLSALLQAQFPNGAFPQVWTAPAPSKPVLRARYPEYDWKLEGRVKNYWDCYTLNDGLAGTVAEVLIEAHRLYGEAKYLAALERLGEFLLAARMPEPQPAWCQQYGFDMVPIWARKFEPPAVTGGESQDAMETLIRIARVTGNRRFLAPVPRALEYLRKSRLPDGRLARYYELRTNRPLYMDAQYRLTYDDAAAPGHYGWKQPARLDAIERALREAQAGAGAASAAPAPPGEAEVRRILAELDAEGRWVSTYAGERLVGQPAFRPGFRYLSSELFSRRVETLSAYLETARPRPARSAGGG